MLLPSIVLTCPAAPLVSGLIKGFCAWLASRVKKQPRNEALSVLFFQTKRGVFENA